MGDLNADLLKPDDAETRALLNLVENHSLKIVKHGATHHTRTTTTNSDTHIDVILFDEHDRLLNYDKFTAPYSRNGHDVITATIGLIVAKSSIPLFSYRDYKGIQPEALMGTLEECDWSVFQDAAFDLHTALECLNTNLTTVIDSLAPLKVVRTTKGFNPWINAGLINLHCK